MRGSWIVVLGMLMTQASWLQAGVYHPAEEQLWPLPASYELFQEKLNQLREIANEKPVVTPNNWLRPHYLKQVADLEAKDQAGKLTVEDQINLSAYYIRLRRYDDAIRVLKDVPSEKQDFRVLANLATAYQLASDGLLDRAEGYLSEALGKWPLKFDGYTEAQLVWYKRVEEYQRKLINSRRAEADKNRGKPPEGVDPIFSKLRFVSDNGKYEPGRLARDQLKELPPDAIDIVMELMLWLPDDERLYWLLGELYNGKKGDPATAKQIFDSIVTGGRFRTSPEMREHRSILTEVKPPEDKSTPAPQTGGISSWKLVAVGFGSGALVAIFGTMQFLEMRRRRQKQT